MHYHFGLIGYPIKHSLSPFLHEEFLRQSGIEGDYSIIEIDPAGDFSEAIASLKQMELNGFNITAPYKQKIMDYLDEIDDSAAQIGAVNTVLCKDNRWIGYNTDGIGYVRSLQNKFPELSEQQNIPILMLGAGGAAKGIYHGLIEHGYHNISIANRTPSKARDILEGLNNVMTTEEAELKLPQFDVIIQTTSVGMKPHTGNAIISLKKMKTDTIVSDIVYQPITTRLLKEAKEMGAPIHMGHTMLIFQAQFAFEIWTNIQPNVDGLDSQLQTKLEG